MRKAESPLSHPVSGSKSARSALQKQLMEMRTADGWTFDDAINMLDQAKSLSYGLHVIINTLAGYPYASLERILINAMDEIRTAASDKASEALNIIGELCGYADYQPVTEAIEVPGDDGKHFVSRDGTEEEQAKAA